MPDIEDTLLLLAGAVYFTVMDLRSGYWQIKVADDLIQYTTWSAGKNVDECVKMPFGLINAPFTFQRCMNMVTHKRFHVVSYLDDLSVFSISFQGHLADLRGLFLRLQY